MEGEGRASAVDGISSPDGGQWLALACAGLLALSFLASRLALPASEVLLALGTPVCFFAAVGLPDWANRSKTSGGKAPAPAPAPVRLETLLPELPALEGDLHALRERLASAEARRQAAVEESTCNRKQLYQLRGELAALTGAEDRVRFLTAASAAVTQPEASASSTSSAPAGPQAGVSDVDDTARLRRECMLACRRCEECRLDMESAEAELARLRDRAGELEAEIEATISRRGAEEASRSSLDEETTALRAKASRLRAKVTAQDAQLIHTRRELHARGGGAEAERKRWENEAALDLQEKRKEVKNEGKEVSRSLRERRQVEAIGESYRSMLEERRREVEELRERRTRVAGDREALEQEVSAARNDLAKKREQMAAAAASRGEGEATAASSPAAGAATSPTDASTSFEAEPSSTTAKSKQKTAKVANKKVKQSTGALEDLELELATVVAAREKAEQAAATSRKTAEAQAAQAQAMAAHGEEECKDIIAKLEEVAKYRGSIYTDREKIHMAASKVPPVEELEKQLKDVEREKIRLRLKIKQVKDEKGL